MSYQITLTNGYILTTIPDDAVDTTTSLSLVGHLYPGYGTIIGNNFVRLLENAASPIAPSAPLTGQLWYDTTHHLMMVWNGSTWYSVTAVTSVLGNSGDVTLAELVAGGMAPLNAPALTGVPTAPTANVGTSNNQIATTAFVVNQVGQLIAGVASVIGIAGNVTLTQLVGKGLAPLDTPAFSGLPTAPTAPVATATTQLATTAFVANKLQSFVTSLSGNAAIWDSTVAVGQAVYYSTATKNYRLASATDDTQAPVGVRGNNNQLVAEGQPYVSSGTSFVQGSHYYVDPINPGNLVTVANNAHVGYATDTSTLLVYDLPQLGLTAATNATVYSARADATFSLSRNDQLADSKTYRFRASSISGTPGLALSLINDLGTVTTDVMQVTRAGTNAVAVNFLTPTFRVLNGSLVIGQNTSSASALYFANNSATATGTIYQAGSLYLSANPTGSSPVTISAVGDLTVTGKAFATTATALANNTQLATTAFVYAATRIKCSSNLSFYISPSGSDTTGTGTTALPYATLQHAYDVARNWYDGAGWGLYLYLMPGTHTSGIYIGVPLATFAGAVNILSQSGSYTNTTLSTPNANGITVSCGANVVISGFTINAPIGTDDLVKQTGNCISVSNGGVLTVGGGMNFGPAGAFHMIAQASGTIGVGAPYVISGGAGMGHVIAAESSTIAVNGFPYSPAGITVTLIGNPAFPASGYGFAASVNSSYLTFTGVNWSGTATGLKFFVSVGGLIGVNGAGLNYLPGTIAGVGNAFVYGGGFYG